MFRSLHVYNTKFCTPRTSFRHNWRNIRRNVYRDDDGRRGNIRRRRRDDDDPDYHD